MNHIIYKQVTLNQYTCAVIIIYFLAHVELLSNQVLAEHVKMLEMHQGVHLKEDIKGTSGVINHHHHNFIATQQGFVPLRYIKPYVERNTYMDPPTVPLFLQARTEIEIA